MSWTSEFAERTELVVGSDGLDRLARSTVCVFGLGGVGAAAAVDLVRAGVGRIIACDFDEVAATNLNRLAFGYARFIGIPKSLAFKEIAAEINPEAQIDARPLFISGAEVESAIPPYCDFYLDCIDSLNSKANLIAALVQRNARFATALGTGGRLDPSRLRLSPIWESHGCPLARTVKQRIRRLGLGEKDFVMSVWSDERASAPGDFMPPHEGLRGRPRRRQGSAPFVPQAAGHLLASYAVRSLIGRTT